MKPWTRIERRILTLLSDGYPHKRDELLQCLSEDDPKLASRGALRTHISKIRSRLVPRGHNIVCEMNKGQYWYRHIVMLKKEDRVL